MFMSEGSTHLSGSRRDLLSLAISSVSAVTLACGILNNPAYAEDIGSKSDNPIVVLGAGGKVCLSLCVCVFVENTAETLSFTVFYNMSSFNTVSVLMDLFHG